MPTQQQISPIYACGEYWHPSLCYDQVLDHQ